MSNKICNVSSFGNTLLPENMFYRQERVQQFSKGGGAFSGTGAVSGGRLVKSGVSGGETFNGNSAAKP